MSVTLAKAKNASKRYVDIYLEIEALKEKMEKEVTIMREYCEENSYTGKIGDVLAYTRSSLKLVGKNTDIEIMKGSLDKKYRTVIPRSTKINVKLVADELDNDETLEELMERMGVKIDKTDKVYFKHQV